MQISKHIDSYNVILCLVFLFSFKLVHLFIFLFKSKQILLEYVLFYLMVFVRSTDSIYFIILFLIKSEEHNIQL